MDFQLLQLKEKKIHQMSIKASELEERIRELERSIEHTQRETQMGGKWGKKKKRTIL